MSNMLAHKGYFGSVQYNQEDKVFHGKIEFIRALVSYEGTDVTGLENAFKDTVDDYLGLCEEQGEKPEQPFKGSFNVRTGTNLHRQAALYAERKGTNLNKVVVEALKNYLITEPEFDAQIEVARKGSGQYRNTLKQLSK